MDSHAFHRKLYWNMSHISPRTDLLLLLFSYLFCFNLATTYLGMNQKKNSYNCNLLPNYAKREKKMYRGSLIAIQLII